MDVSPSPDILRAFLMPIAFFRAINGSYDIHSLRKLSYHRHLTDKEWKNCLHFYHANLQQEIDRNQKQKDKHTMIKAHLKDKIARLKAIAKKIPEISDVFLVNSYALGALRPTSDIDLLVITHPKALWWARLRLTVQLELAGIRRKPGNIEEQICLSFFAAENHLDMSKISIENDIYLAYWSTQIKPLLHKSENTWWQQNQWLRALFPAFDKIDSSGRDARVSKFSPFAHLANALVRLPMKIRAQHRAQQLGAKSSIIISDSMFKFHNEDRRELYREQTLQELATLESLMLSEK